MSTHTREEKDSMGTIHVDTSKYWGAQTQRSLKYFGIGQDTMPPELIQGFGVVKWAAATINERAGVLTAQQGQAIREAADAVIGGDLHEHFPLRIWQTGSGTQTNMNTNEVIANYAIQALGGTMGSKDPIHPNDHVNASQSSNDTFPSAMHIAAASYLVHSLLPSLQALGDTLETLVTRHRDLVKIGRTHLQDAVPLTLGQEFSGHLALIRQDQKAITDSLEGLYELALGGSAVGTGLNTPPQFADDVAACIAEKTGLPFRSADNKFAALSGHNALVLSHSALKSLACSLTKIANDIRWLASGPRCGLGELSLPENEPGSSIMPGKVNPTQCEALTMVCAQVMGNDTAITMGASQGHFELNVYKPMIIHNFMHSAHLLSDCMAHFRQYCVAGLSPREDRIQHYVDRSLMLVTALSPVIGYDRAAQAAHHAHHHQTSLKDACVSLGYLSDTDFDKHVDPKAMTMLGDN